MRNTPEEQLPLSEADQSKARWRRVGHITTFLGIGLLIPVALASVCQIVDSATGGIASDTALGFNLSPLAMQVCAGLGFALYFAGIYAAHKANGDKWNNLGAPLVLSSVTVGISSYLLPHLIADWGPHLSAAVGFGIGFIVGAGFMIQNLARKSTEIEYNTGFTIPFTGFTLPLPIICGAMCALSAGVAPIIANTISDQVGWSITFSILISGAFMHFCLEKSGLMTQDL